MNILPILFFVFRLKSPIHSRRVSRAFSYLLVILVGFYCVVRTGSISDQSMRDEHLRNAKIASAAIGRTVISTLAGDETDLETENYQALKRQLMRITETIDDIRFAYLMGRNKDGEVFFYIDSEPAESEDNSPPGQIFDEVSDMTKASFDNGEPFVEGPVTDRWGMWISGLVPITDPDSGRIIAVFGIDEPAGDWNDEIYSRQILPFSMSVFALFFLFAYYRYRDHRKALVRVHREEIRKILALLDEDVRLRVLEEEAKKHRRP